MTHTNLAPHLTAPSASDERPTTVRLSFEVIAVILSFLSLALVIAFAVNELPGIAS
ncbi:hypothetical protein [Rhodocaloribacter sp.]